VRSSGQAQGVTAFVDPVNPTPEEICRWALSADLEPMQDWDLIIADEANGDVLIDLVEQGMRAATFLRSLNVLSSGAVRTAFHSCTRQSLQRLVERASGGEHAWDRTWGRRTEALMLTPRHSITAHGATAGWQPTLPRPNCQ
jgi:hypothetical protein